MSCESATKIITAIYSLPEVDDCICKLVRKEHREDFKQELFLILLEQPCDKVVQMNGTFKYFVVRIILNLVRQKKNVYHTKYLDPKTTYNTDIVLYQSTHPAEHDTMAERIDREQKEQDLLIEINNLDQIMGTFYHRELLKIVVKEGGQQAAARKLGIRQSSISDSVRKVRNYLKGL